MAKYDYKSEKTQMLKALMMSKALKIKHGWSRDAGAGFIAEDIVEMENTNPLHLRLGRADHPYKGAELEGDRRGDQVPGGWRVILKKKPTKDEGQKYSHAETENH